MPTMNLEEMLAAGPGKSLDFKRDATSAAGLARTVVAFANSAGGTLVVGIDPVSRDVRGVADPFSLEEKLAAQIADSVRPRPAFDSEILSWRQVQLLAVRVHPGAQRPYQLRRGGLDEGVYVRAGAEDRLADPAMIEDMRRRARGVSYDEEPCEAAGADDLDRAALDDAFRRLDDAAAPPDPRELRLLVEADGRMVPTRGGAILFGRDRLTRFPDAWIQAGRFGGEDTSRILDSSELRSPLPAAVEEAMAFALRNLTRSSRIEGVRRIEEHALPPVALRESIVNAVVHADYSQRGAPIRLALFDDRVEVTSPGLLPSGLTLADLDHGISRIRNRVIGRVFHALGLVEQWGSGIARMRAAMADAGLAPPALEEIGLAFRVTLRTERVGEPAVDARDGAILDLLAARGPMSTGEVAQEIGLSDRAIRTRLRSLVERGAAVEIGSARNDPQRKYAVLDRKPNRLT
jgi:ATP-dependent DNA helicase RecG